MKPTYIFTILAIIMNCAVFAQRALPPLPTITEAQQSQVTTTVVRVRGKQPYEVTALSSLEKSTNVVYQDGLGRSVQSVMVASSPTAKDLVQHIAYDAFGRSPKTFLPYVSVNNTGNFNSGAEAAQLAFYNNPVDNVSDDAAPYSLSVFEALPMDILKEQGAPGADWQPGTAHTVRVNTTMNTVADQVRQFNTDGTSSGFFPANTLYAIETTSEDGVKTINFKDKLDRTLLTRRVAAVVIGGANTDLETYYIYNEMNQLRYTIQPKGVAFMKTNNWLLDASIKDQYVFENVYDQRGRPIEQKVPGAGWSYVVYDQLNRPVLTQHANQTAAKQWMFTKFDRKGRPVLAGIYTDIVNITRTSLQQILDAKNYSGPDAYFEIRQASSTFGYSNNAFPNTNIAVRLVNYYDDYDLDYNGTADFAYLPQGLGSEEPVLATTVRGLPTASKKLILNTATWLTEVIFYDRYYRPVQRRSNNALNATVEDVATSVLDFEGKALKKVTFQKVAVGKTITVLNRYDYDAKGRIIRAYEKINTLPEKTLATYRYNAVGQLVEKNLGGMGSTGAEGFLQSIDFKYNIRGWLTHINNSELKYDALFNNDNDDVFGMELLYNKIDNALANTAQYDGTVAAVKWQHNDALNNNQPKRQRAYTFDYFANDQLKNANYKAWNGTAWTAEVGAYDMKNLSYDHNGNIMGYERYSKASDAAAIVKTDHLTYSYGGNQLLQVEDAGTGAGFVNGFTNTVEYFYDANGNLIDDKNKGVTLGYNDLNKTTNVTKAGVAMLAYEYTADGARVSSTTTQGGTAGPKQTYVANFVYQGTDLLYYTMGEGKVNRKADGSFEYEYMVSDQQGNVRATFREKTVTNTYTATMEDNGQAVVSNPRVVEMQYYQSLFDVEQPQVGPWLNHSAATTAVPTPNRAAYLTGTGVRKIGPGISLKVKPGDQLHIEAYGKFLKPSANPNFGNAIVAGLAAAFGGSFAGINGVEGGGATGLYNNASAAMGSGYGGSFTDRPRAFINYLLFDDNFTFVNAGWDRIDPSAGFLQNQENSVAWDKVQIDITVQRSGYVYIYTSNETEGSAVWFDDVSVTHTARVAEVTTANDYYPFGLRHEGLANNTPSITAPNQYNYNGGSQWQNEASNFANYLSTPLREYDPVLGRFNGVDVLGGAAPGWTPYRYAFNNPFTYNDPSGAVEEGSSGLAGPLDFYIGRGNPEDCGLSAAFGAGSDYYRMIRNDAARAVPEPSGFLLMASVAAAWGLRRLLLRRT